MEKVVGRRPLRTLFGQEIGSNLVQRLGYARVIFCGVDPRRVQAGVPQYLAHGVEVAGRTEQGHCRGVPHCVRREALLAQCRILLSSHEGVLPNDVSNTEPRDCVSPLSEEERRLVITSISQRLIDGCHGALPEWYSAPAASLAEHAQVAGTLSTHVLGSQARHLTRSAAGVEEHEQHGPVPSPLYGVELRRLDDRLHLVGLEVTEQFLLILLGRNGRHPPACDGEEGIAVGHEVAKALDDCEPVVACGNGNAPRALQLPEEPQDVGGKVLREDQILDPIVGAVGKEPKEEDHRVPVRVHGAGAQPALGHRPVEVVLHQRRQERAIVGLSSACHGFSLLCGA